MPSTEINVFKRRIAQTTKANSARKLPNGLWSVVCSEGLMDKSEGTASKAKIMDVAFYFTREDAWEESAYLLGKRPNETPGRDWAPPRLLRWGGNLREPLPDGVRNFGHRTCRRRVQHGWVPAARPQRTYERAVPVVAC